MASDPQRTQREWRAELQPTPDCLATDRVGADLTAAEQDHLAGCLLCQAELRLWETFKESRAGSDETVVQDIVADLTERQWAKLPSPAPVGVRRLTAGPWLSVAAVVILVVGLGYALWDPQPALGPPGGDDRITRSADLRIVSPIGDVLRLPLTFEWIAFEGAARYDVTVREVDGTELWTGSSVQPSVDLPPELGTIIVPGKTVIWVVTAIDAAGEILATSAPQRFRVVIPRLTPGE